MMNGLSGVFDQIVTNSYLSLSSTPDSQTEPFGQQLAFDAFGDKALEGEHRLDSSDANHFDANPFDADNCLNNYFCEQQLTQDWNQLNANELNESLINGINSNDLNQCFNSFDTNFESNLDLIANTNTISIKQNNKKSNPKKLSRKEQNPSASARPPKPVSAYALFFRDAQSVIKSSNPSASFGEISKVVASNWEALDKSNKNIYKQRADQQKKNYLKTLASSRAQQIAGLMAESSAKLSSRQSSASDSVLSDNRFTNETNRQNDKQNNFESTQHQMSDNKGSNPMRNNSNDNQNLSDNSGQQLQNFVPTAEQSGSGVAKQHCIRSGCGNDSVDSPEWDSEYCSSECCVKHCSDVFQAWVQKQEHFPQNN